MGEQIRRHLHGLDILRLVGPMYFILECFEKLVETFCRLLDFFVCFFLRHFWLASEIAKDWRVANVVPCLLKKGGSREEE